MLDTKVRQTATLDQWSIRNFAGGQFLTGMVMGHPILNDGAYIQTSWLVGEITDGVATTLNTDYTLLDEWKPLDTASVLGLMLPKDDV